MRCLNLILCCCLVAVNALFWLSISSVRILPRFLSFLLSFSFLDFDWDLQEHSVVWKLSAVGKSVPRFDALCSYS
jgi:hypothetical protein